MDSHHGEPFLHVVVPVYDEDSGCVRRAVDELYEALSQWNHLGLIVTVIDDGSAQPLQIEDFVGLPGFTLLRNPVNRGYGASIKSAILKYPSKFVAICDADGTYPISNFAELVSHLPEYDLVIGARVGKIRQIPLLRRLPKRFLNLLASYFAGSLVKDLNSGMRVFSRELAIALWELIPNGFSLTSTLTMGALLSGFRVRDVTIDYYRRQGKSSIKPISDTIRFVMLVLRVGILFAPQRFFSPIAGLVFILGFAKAVLRDYPMHGQIGNLAVLMMLSGLQIYLMGVLGQLIISVRQTGKVINNDSAVSRVEDKSTTNQ